MRLVPRNLTSPRQLASFRDVYRTTRTRTITQTVSRPKPVQSRNGLHKFPPASARRCKLSTAPPPKDDLSSKKYDAEQLRLMEELCIVIDKNDVPLRAGTKKECPSLTPVSTHSRPFNGKHQQWPPPQSLLTLPLQSAKQETFATTTGSRENHIPESMDEYLLFTPPPRQRRTGGGFGE